MSSLLSRAAQAVRGVLEGPRPLADAPCEPLDTSWGPAPVPGPAVPWTGAAALGLSVAAALGETAWDRCPDSGAVLPDAPWDQLGGGVNAWAAARELHAHQWFSTLARAGHETGDRALARAASDALGEWLLQDVPGHGVAWAHASDAAARLMHWALGAGWLGDELDPDLRRRMAGSVPAHAAWLERGLSLSEGDHKLVFQAAGLVVAGLAWPELPEARRRWSRGLALLGRALPRQLHDDGSALLGVPALSARMVSAVWVARAFCRENGVAFPADADAALARLSWTLRVLSEGTGTLPPIGACHQAPLLAPWGLDAARSAWNAVVGLGLAPGDATPDADTDATAAWLSGRVVAPGAPLQAGNEWAMWAFRNSGTVVMLSEAKKRPVRLVFWGALPGDARPAAQVHGDGFQLLLDVGDVPVLVDPGADADHLELGLADAHGTCLVDGRGVPRRQGQGWAPFSGAVERARVDGRNGAVVVSHDGFGGGRYRRDLRAEGTKLVITERFEGLADGDVEVRWPLGPGFEPEPAKHGWTATHAGVTLAIKLDESLDWRFERGLVLRDGEPHEACVIVGRGTVTGNRRIRSTFELR